MTAAGLYFLAVAVHFLIIILILAGDDGLPPLTVLQIPLDGLFDTVCEFGFRQPAQLVVDLSRVDGVTHVVALAVSNVSDQAFRLAQLLTDELDDIDILHLVVAADVVNLTDTALVDDQVDGLAVILYIQPVADI